MPFIKHIYANKSCYLKESKSVIKLGTSHKEKWIITSAWPYVNADNS